MSTTAPPTLTLEQLKQLVLRFGYRIETSEDGTERLIRPDGTVALIARRKENSGQKMRNAQRCNKPAPLNQPYICDRPHGHTGPCGQERPGRKGVCW
jgi:hypothetical protein